MGAGRKKKVRLGRVSGSWGVKGWIKVHSYTEPLDNIVGFDTWWLEQDGAERRFEVESGGRAGKRIVAKLRGVDDRDEARKLLGAVISVEREALPPCESGEYYWADLEGLAVRNTRGELLGEVDYLMATGANDVLVLRGGGDKLIPFVAGTVREVDIEGGAILVDWESSYWEQ